MEKIIAFIDNKTNLQNSLFFGKKIKESQQNGSILIMSFDSIVSNIEAAKKEVESWGKGFTVLNKKEDQKLIDKNTKHLSPTTKTYLLYDTQYIRDLEITKPSSPEQRGELATKLPLKPEQTTTVNTTNNIKEITQPTTENRKSNWKMHVIIYCMIILLISAAVGYAIEHYDLESFVKVKEIIIIDSEGVIKEDDPFIPIGNM